MIKALQFELSAEFGLFRRPDQQTSNLTFNFIPKSAILGICGAILGLSGYKNKEKPEFFERLKHFKISIFPINENCSYTPFRKTFVKFNNFHGYGNEDGNGIYTDQVLMSPKYRITIFADENDLYFNKLVELISNNLTVYRPYLGKNEFIADIQYLGTYVAIENNSRFASCESIFPINKNFRPPQRAESLTPGTRLIMEDYPYSLDKNCNYLRANFCLKTGDIYLDEADRNLGSFYSLDNLGTSVIFAF